MNIIKTQRECRFIVSRMMCPSLKSIGYLSSPLLRPIRVVFTLSKSNATSLIAISVINAVANIPNILPDKFIKCFSIYITSLLIKGRLKTYTRTSPLYIKSVRLLCYKYYNIK